jgi:UDP-N-acetyl-D-galactosamine dehydrogenase
VADLVTELKAWGVSVVVADPWANANEVMHEYGIALGRVTVDKPVDALVVSVGHQEFRSLSLAELKALCRSSSPVLADLKALYDRHEAVAEGFTVFRL